MDKHANLKDESVLANLKAMKIVHEKEQAKQVDMDQETIRASPDDLWLLQNALKVEKIRNRVQKDAEKFNRF